MTYGGYPDERGEWRPPSRPPAPYDPGPSGPPPQGGYGRHAPLDERYDQDEPYPQYPPARHSAPPSYPSRDPRGYPPPRPNNPGYARPPRRHPDEYNGGGGYVPEVYETQGGTRYGRPPAGAWPYAAATDTDERDQWTQRRPGPPVTPGRPGRLPDRETEVHDREPEPPRRRLTGLLALFAVLVLVAGAGLVIAFILHSNGSHTTGNSPSLAGTDPKLIADQTVDPKPLTAAEVFGAKSVPSAAAGGAYQVVKSEALAGCAGAVTDHLAQLLQQLGCTQVVRATLLSPDQAYVITAGIFNLKDTASASKAFDEIGKDIDSGQGRFGGLGAGGITDVITVAQAHLAWDAHGHYLVYCVIALTNGKAIADQDSRTNLIINDVVERYLGDTVIANRERHSGSRSTPAATPS
jgi:hypothetical protein